MTLVTRSNGQLRYEIFGKGPKNLLAFHGFGQSRQVFSSWGKQLGDQYKIYAFDVFYHGDSQRATSPLSKVEWKKWLVDFLDQEKIDSYGTLGYSLGGRFAIASSMMFPERITEVNLVAPDGVFLTPWFKLATTPGLRGVFKYFMMHPNRLERLLSFNDRSKIINKYIADFARKEMGDYENRKRVYLSWNHFKPLGYTHKELNDGFEQIQGKKKLVVGDHDHIITPKGILPIIERMRGFHVYRLPLKHHQLIKPEVAEVFKSKV